MDRDAIVIMFDYQGIGDILKNNSGIKQIQEELAQRALSSAEAAFIDSFGIQGKFEITNFTNDRQHAKIGAADAKTAAILKHNPGWMQQFIGEMSI